MPPSTTLRWDPQHSQAQGVGRRRVLADRADPKAPSEAEQADLDHDDQRVGDVQEDRRVEEDRPDDRDLAEQRDLDRLKVKP